MVFKTGLTHLGSDASKLSRVQFGTRQILKIKKIKLQQINKNVNYSVKKYFINQQYKPIINYKLIHYISFFYKLICLYFLLFKFVVFRIVHKTLYYI